MNIDESIQHQRELCADSDIEIRRIKSALAIAESVSAGRHGALGELLELKQRQQTEIANIGERVFKHGRYASVEEGGV